MSNNRKTFALILTVLAMGLALTGCMNSGTAGALPSPTATAGYAPQATATAAPTAGTDAANSANTTGTSGNTGSTTNGALTPFDWANGAADIESAIAQLSEIAEARVVVADTTALVGVKFDSAYKGQLTERIREMVASEVLKVDPTLQTVAVTAADEDVKKVYALSDGIRAGRTASELAPDINAIVRSATTLR